MIRKSFWVFTLNSCLHSLMSQCHILGHGGQTFTVLQHLYLFRQTLSYSVIKYFKWYELFPSSNIQTGCMDKAQNRQLLLMILLCSNQVKLNNIYRFYHIYYCCLTLFPMALTNLEMNVTNTVKPLSIVFQGDGKQKRYIRENDSTGKPLKLEIRTI
jgi:hypothetical protein